MQILMSVLSGVLWKDVTVPMPPAPTLLGPIIAPARVDLLGTARIVQVRDGRRREEGT